MTPRTLFLSTVLLLAACFTPVDVGTQAPCTLGQDQTCNADPSQSSLAGACVADGGVAECVCSAGFERDSAGRCQVVSCGPNTCGSCAAPCTNRDVCTSSGWQCKCDCPAPCTVGVASSCNDTAVDGGVGGVAGQCVQGASGPECTCSAGFERNPATGRCRPTTPSCGPDTCGSCAAPCVNRHVCTATGWQCGCDCPTPCTLGVDSSCAEGLVDAGVGVTAGRCVEGQAGPTCICAPGFTPTTTGRCAPTTTAVCTTRQSCNAIAAMSSFAGECVPNGGGGTACVCSATFLNDDTGRCAPALCLETQGATCRWTTADGTAATNGVCGTMSVSPGCACGKTSAGAYVPYCTGACLPNDGGITRDCFPFNCGPIACVTGETTCASYGACQ